MLKYKYVAYHLYPWGEIQALYFGHPLWAVAAEQ